MPVALQLASGRNNTPQNMGPALHQVLIAAGWTLRYADADAIGTGTADNPAWTKAPVANASAGRVVYQMPAVAGFPTRWCLQIAFFWGPVTSSVAPTVTSALGVNPDGSLISPGSPTEFNPINGSNVSTDWYVNAYEHGLTMAMHHATLPYLLNVERRRTPNGIVTDDLQSLAAGSSSGTPRVHGTSGSGGSGRSGVRGALSGEAASQFFVHFVGSNSSAPATLNRSGGQFGFPQGPFNISGDFSGVPRLVVALPPGDCVQGVDASIFVDDGMHSYYVGMGVGPGAASGVSRWAYARD